MRSWRPMPLMALTLASTSVASVLYPRGCHADNCLRAVENPTRAASASSLCSSILETSLAPTATASLPAWLGNCGTTSQISRISSACACFLPSTSLVPTSTSTQRDSSTCPTIPPPTTTITSTITNILTSTCAAPSTITIGGTTVTLSASTETVTITPSTSTVTSTVTSAFTSTIATPQPSSCGSLLGNPAFENPNRELFPWRIATDGLGGPGTGAGLQQDSPNSNVYFVFNCVRGQANPLIRLWQGISTCAGTYSVRFRFKTGSTGGWTFVASMANTAFSLTATRAERGVWTNVNLGTWALGDGSGEFRFEVRAAGPGTGQSVVYIDDILLVKI